MPPSTWTSGAALCLCLLLTVTSVEMIRVWQSRTDSLGATSIGLISVAIVVCGAVTMFRFIKRFGQGGALLETGSVRTPLTGGLADNAHWILGVMYVDKTDPSLMVERRFGVGYTFNLGNRVAVLILATFLVASLGLLVITLVKLNLFS